MHLQCWFIHLDLKNVDHWNQPMMQQLKAVSHIASKVWKLCKQESIDQHNKYEAT